MKNEAGSARASHTGWRLLEALAVVATFFVVAGCRPHEPLERRVEAKHYNELLGWIRMNSPDLGVDLTAELRSSLSWIGDSIPGYSAPSKPRALFARGDKVCLRVDGLSAREVIILGHECAVRTLVQSNNTDAENMRRLMLAVDVEQLDAAQRRADVMNEVIKRRIAAMDVHLARVRELRREPPDPSVGVAPSSGPTPDGG